MVCEGSLSFPEQQISSLLFKLNNQLAHTLIYTSRVTMMVQ